MDATIVVSICQYCLQLTNMKSGIKKIQWLFWYWHTITFMISSSFSRFNHGKHYRIMDQVNGRHLLKTVEA
jgi:hypothetical protein